MAGIEYLESLEGGIDLENLGLPISNTENKQLETQVQQKEKQITLLQRKADEHKDRIQAITDHLKMSDKSYNKLRFVADPSTRLNSSG